MAEHVGPRVRSGVRRAFPYLVIGITGFAIAYIVVFVFVLPSKIIPPKKKPYTPDTTTAMIAPIDTMPQPAPNAITVAPPIGPGYIPPPPPIPVDVPDLQGMALPDARGVLNTLQLNTVVTQDTSSLQPPNTVLRQLPAPGKKVPEHGTVQLVVSRFPPVRDSAARGWRDSKSDSAFRDSLRRGLHAPTPLRTPMRTPANPYPKIQTPIQVETTRTVPKPVPPTILPKVTPTPPLPTVPDTALHPVPPMGGTDSVGG